MIKGRSLLACTGLAAFLFSSCGSSSDNPPSDAGAMMSAAGDVVVACSYPAKFTCGALTVHGAPAAQVAMDMCRRDSGTPLSVCPSANLIGCCTQSTLKNCYYMGFSTAAAKLTMDCMAAGGMWATTP